MVVAGASVGRLESILDHLATLGHSLLDLSLLFNHFYGVWLRRKLLRR